MDFKKKSGIKYIEDNIIYNNNNEVFAYYELMPYNYKFVSDDVKLSIHNSFKQLLSQNKSNKIQALQIATEISVANVQEKCKKLVKGSLKEVALNRIDGQTEFLTQNSENEVEYRFFIGFKLELSEEELNFANIKKKIVNSFKEFIGEVDEYFLGDYLIIPKNESSRYKLAENFLYSKIKGRFNFRKLTSIDVAYLLEKLNGLSGISYDEYDYNMDLRENEEDTFVKVYDIYKPSRCEFKEKGKYIEIKKDNSLSYVSYLTIENISKDLIFPSSEIFYYQQLYLPFPIDISMNIEVLENKKALKTVRNKKKELKDLKQHAYSSGNESSDDVEVAYDDVSELEFDLSRAKEPLFKVSYLIRVSAGSYEKLQERITSVVDFYDDLGIKLVCPYGDMVGFHNEFQLSESRYINDYIQYVASDFLASLGFGVTQKIGDNYGIYLGYDVDTGKNVYINPSLPAQGKDTVTNALAKCWLGSLGGGKSMACNYLTYYSVIYGGKCVILDPKSERSNWKEHLKEVANEINIVSLTSDKENIGLLDPFVILDDVNDSVALALDILTYLTGVTIHDGKRFTALSTAINNVSTREKRGLLCVIDELKKGSEVAKELALHIESFTNYSFANLLFSNGENVKSIKLDKSFNIIQVAELILPEPTKTQDEYTSIEMLSVAMLIVIATFSLGFIKQDNSIFKVVLLDEAWAFLNVMQGKTLTNKLVRTGRSLNSAVDLVTQSANDVGDNSMRNNIGMKFAFRSRDIGEIEKIIEFFGLDKKNESLRDRIMGLSNGECLFQDSYGRTGVVKVDIFYKDLFNAFDTRPPLLEE